MPRRGDARLSAFYEPILRAFRTRRMIEFCRTHQVTDRTTILDVGGTPFNWTLIDCRAQITLLNLTEAGAELPPNITAEVGDGLDLPYSDGEFDVVFSNSVIEHVGDAGDQQQFADELSRVGRGLWVQTPARSFIVEPHLVAVGIHYLPKRWQRRLVRRFSLRGWLQRPSQAEIDALLDELRLLSRDELQQMFPDCEIRPERFFGMDKSYVAVRLAA